MDEKDILCAEIAGTVLLNYVVMIPTVPVVVSLYMLYNDIVRV